MYVAGEDTSHGVRLFVAGVTVADATVAGVFTHLPIKIYP